MKFRKLTNQKIGKEELKKKRTFEIDRKELKKWQIPPQPY